MVTRYSILVYILSYRYKYKQRVTSTQQQYQLLLAFKYGVMMQTEFVPATVAKVRVVPVVARILLVIG